MKSSIRWLATLVDENRDYFERRKDSPSRDNEYLDDRERDRHERRKFVDASKMRRVSVCLFIFCMCVFLGAWLLYN